MTTLDFTVTLEPHHIWNFDNTLAQVLAQGLQSLLDNGHNVMPEGIEEAADTFARYAAADVPADDDKVSPDELTEALLFVAINFQSLWD